jgi:hypothetical protein
VTGSFVHGTYNAYFWGECRCTLCREGQRQRVARNRAERLASGSLSHGTRSAYDAGCRCEPCKDARRAAYQRLDSERRP